MKDTKISAEDRLARLEARLQDLTTPEGLPAPPRRQTNVYVSEIDRKQSEARERRLEAAAQRAADEQEQARKEAPQRARRAAERKAVDEALVEEQLRHEVRWEELTRLKRDLALAPLGKRVSGGKVR